jgi:hypothetical protein
MYRPFHRFLIPALASVVGAVLFAGCGNNASTSTTTPSSTTTTPTAADATINETFNGTLPVGGSNFYSFNVGVYGTVNLTLTSVGGTGVPSTLWLGLGIGQPSGTTCPTTTSIDTQAGTAVQVTGTYQPGVYCADVWDIGNLAAPATFSVAIAHP